MTAAKLLEAMPLCEDCGYGFDPNDPRSQNNKWGLRCPLCKEFHKASICGASWAMRNECQGLFDHEVFIRKSECEAEWDKTTPSWREWPDGRVVPVVLIEIERDHPAYRDVVHHDHQREELRRDYLAREAVVRAKLLSLILSRSSRE